MNRTEKLARLDTALAALRETIAEVIPPDPRAPMKVAPVTYLYPTPARVLLEWKRWRETADLVILNPASGPGTSANAEYGAEAVRCADAGVVVLGYNACTWGARPIQDVVDENARLFSHYPPLSGNIFLDEVSTANTQTNRDYLKRVRDATPGKLHLNPGTTCPEWFMETCDTVMIAETTAAKYMTRTMPAWVSKYEPERFYHCIHDCPPDQLEVVLKRAQENGAGYVYVTNLTGTGRYGSPVAAFYDAFVAAVRAMK